MMTEQASTGTSRRTLVAITVIWLLALIASGISPRDRLTWFMEVAPVLIAWPLLFATRDRFPFTTLAYALVCAHGLILIVGGTYTYAHVPAGFWVQEWLGLARNPYDRLGHLAQGFIPAIVAREILVRTFRFVPGRFLFFVTTSICLAISAFYELIEWWSALALGQGAHEFLGTQGDEWDTQWDMFLALAGACAAQLLLSRLHDRQITALR
jgi:putative membrane protein